MRRIDPRLGRNGADRVGSRWGLSVALLLGAYAVLAVARGRLRRSVLHGPERWPVDTPLDVARRLKSVDPRTDPKPGSSVP